MASPPSVTTPSACGFPRSCRWAGGACLGSLGSLAACVSRCSLHVCVACKVQPGAACTDMHMQGQLGFACQLGCIKGGMPWHLPYMSALLTLRFWLLPTFAPCCCRSTPLSPPRRTFRWVLFGAVLSKAHRIDLGRLSDSPLLYPSTVHLGHALLQIIEYPSITVFGGFRLQCLLLHTATSWGCSWVGASGSVPLLTDGPTRLALRSFSAALPPAALPCHMPCQEGRGQWPSCHCLPSSLPSSLPFLPSPRPCPCPCPAPTPACALAYAPTPCPAVRIFSGFATESTILSEVNSFMDILEDEGRDYGADLVWVAVSSASCFIHSTAGAGWVWEAVRMRAGTTGLTWSGWR